VNESLDERIDRVERELRESFDKQASAPRRWHNCDWCNGTGEHPYANSSNEGVCSKCSGRGRILRKIRNATPHER
jgi:DnaJ-class molecular chaperone